MISQEINLTPGVFDKETALDEYGRRCQAVTLAEKKLNVFKRDYPHHDAGSVEATVQTAKAYAQQGWEVVLSYLR